MKQDEQAILARDMIQMIRENADNSDICIPHGLAAERHSRHVASIPRSVQKRYERRFIWRYGS